MDRRVFKSSQVFGQSNTIQLGKQRVSLLNRCADMFVDAFEEPHNFNPVPLMRLNGPNQGLMIAFGLALKMRFSEFNGRTIETVRERAHIIAQALAQVGSCEPHTFQKALIDILNKDLNVVETADDVFHFLERSGCLADYCVLTEDLRTDAWDTFLATHGERPAILLQNQRIASRDMQSELVARRKVMQDARTYAERCCEIASIPFRGTPAKNEFTELMTMDEFFTDLERFNTQYAAAFKPDGKVKNVALPACSFEGSNIDFAPWPSLEPNFTGRLAELLDKVKSDRVAQSHIYTMDPAKRKALTDITDKYHDVLKSLEDLKLLMPVRNSFRYINAQAIAPFLHSCIEKLGQLEKLIPPLAQEQARSVTKYMAAARYLATLNSGGAPLRTQDLPKHRIKLSSYQRRVEKMFAEELKVVAERYIKEQEQLIRDGLAESLSNYEDQLRGITDLGAIAKVLSEVTTLSSDAQGFKYVTDEQFLNIKTKYELNCKITRKEILDLYEPHFGGHQAKTGQNPPKGDKQKKIPPAQETQANQNGDSQLNIRTGKRDYRKTSTKPNS